MRPRVAAGRGVGRAGRAGSGSAIELGDVEEMALARVVEEAFAAPAEEVAAQQCQGLGQFGVFLLQSVVFGRGPVEHALELVDAAPGVIGPLLRVIGPLSGGLGLPPQLVVAAEQVLEQPPAFRRIVGDMRRDAHDMNYTRYFMLCKSIPADFPASLGPQPVRRNRLRWRAVLRSMPDRSMASCAGWSSTPSPAVGWGIWKVPRLESLDVGITMPSFLWRYTNSAAVRLLPP